MTIDQYLQQSGISKGRFAELIGVSAARVSQLLRGDSHPSPELAARIEQITNGAITVAELLAGRIPPGYRLEKIEAQP